MIAKVKGGDLINMGNVTLPKDFVENRMWAIRDWYVENGKYDYDLEDIRDTCRSVALKEMDGVIFENSIFAVNKYEGKSADELVHTEELKGKCVWLSIKRKDKGDNIKWSDKMSIMENLLGDEWLGIEIYPPAKFMVDTANQYHLICIPPEFTDHFPFGWKHREVMSVDIKGGYNKLGQTYRGNRK